MLDVSTKLGVTLPFKFVEDGDIIREGGTDLRVYKRRATARDTCVCTNQTKKYSWQVTIY